MSALGQVLLWLGFLGGALAAVFRLEVEGDPWRTIDWGPYLGCVAVGVVGVVLLRHDRAARRTTAGGSDEGVQAISRHLDLIAMQVETLADEVGERTCEDVLERIDGRCVPVIAEFVDGREVISHRYSAKVYADVMTEFASGERYLNRAWSAAADGYVDEVEKSLKLSTNFFHAAKETLAREMGGAAEVV